jgi:hypothetical protein
VVGRPVGCFTQPFADLNRPAHAVGVNQIGTQSGARPLATFTHPTVAIDPRNASRSIRRLLTRTRIDPIDAAGAADHILFETLDVFPPVRAGNMMWLTISESSPGDCPIANIGHQFPPESRAQSLLNLAGAEVSVHSGAQLREIASSHPCRSDSVRVYWGSRGEAGRHQIRHFRV